MNKSNCDVVIILLIDLGKKSNLMTNKEQANNLEGANIECIGKNISNSINIALGKVKKNNKKNKKTNILMD